MQATPNRFSAKIHQVEVAWRLSNTRAIVVGPEPRLVLALRALRDVELLLLRVDFPEFLSAPGEGYSMLAQVPRVFGQRQLRPDGEPWIAGLEDVDAGPMLAGKPEDAIAAAQQVRWHGETARVLEHNVCRHPFDYWAYCGRVSVPRGLCLGVIVRADRPTACRIKLAGV